MGQLDRRSLLIGSAGLALAACTKGASESDPEASSGPKIHRPEEGNAVTADDAAALRDRLNEAFRSGDADQLVELIDPEDFALDDVRKRWSRRFENFDRLGFVKGEWFVGVPGGRTRNAAGGAVEYSGSLVFAHRVEGADAQPVVETYASKFRKASEDAPLELMHLGEPTEHYDPAFWDVADIDAIETKHARIAFRKGDAATAARVKGQIESGAAKAFDLMPRPKGVSKVFYALTWPGIDGRLWGGVAVGDARAHAYYHSFVDPSALAKGQEKPTDTKGLPKGTGRVGMHQDSLDSDTERTACHEAIHILANQWLTSGGAPQWASEGLATWGDRGAGRVMQEYGGQIRSAFGRFAAMYEKDPFDVDFYAKNQDVRWENYLCSAAIFACLEDTKGRSAVFDTAQEFYSSSTGASDDPTVDRTQQIMARTRTWLDV